MAALEEVNSPLDETFFQNISGKRKPVVIRKLNIGDAGRLWTPGYLADALGQTPVKIHVCPVAQMDFLKKNFLYRTLPFNDFITRASKNLQEDPMVSPTEKYYLRSIASSNPRKDVADINTDFPKIAKDIKLPDFIPNERLFSSVFRIGSADMQLWTHYDIMDNILMQIVGRKKIVMFSPQDALNLYLNGDKSEIIDIDNPDYQRYPKFRDAVRYECILNPGDAIFIPAMWFHNVIALDFSVAVNVFYKHLDNSLYDHKDVYGNKDPVPAARAFQMIDKAMKILDELPTEYKDFYGRLMISKIGNKCCFSKKMSSS